LYVPAVVKEERRSWRLDGVVGLGCGAAAAGALSYAAVAHRVVGGAALPLDDSWIHLQFARTLAAGGGLAFEPGELVAASTAPLWTAVLSLLAPLPGSAALWSQLAGMAFFLLAVLAFRGLARELGMGPRLSLVATLLFAVSGPMVWSAVSGLEIPLFILLTLVACRVHLRDRDTSRGLALSLPLFALAALARPEGVLLLGLAVADRGLAVRFRPGEWWGGAWRGLLVSAFVVAPVAAFNLLVSGSVLPTTFAAKSGGVQSLWPSLRYLDTVIGLLFRGQPYMTLLAGAGVVALGRRLFTLQDRGLLPALWLVGLPLAYSCLASAGNSSLVGNFGRYIYPLVPFVILLGCLGLSPWGDRLSGWRSRARAPLLGAVFLLVAWPTLAHWRTTAGQFAQSVHDVETGDAAAARWLGGWLPAGATLAVNDIGAIKYLLPQHRIYDLAGLVTPEVHRYTRAAVEEGASWEVGMARYLQDVQPDYLVVFPEWFPGLLASGISFERLKEFTIAGNITLGGDRLVIYSTPWTRRRDPQ
jgi:hypothetical protein